jgi:hypothetical protein
MFQFLFQSGSEQKTVILEPNIHCRAVMSKTTRPASGSA